MVAEARRDSAGTRPQLRQRDGLSIVTYRRTRVFVDRDAWEILPADGVLLMQVRPSHEAAFDLAFTPDELESVFGEVRDADCWEYR